MNKDYDSVDYEDMSPVYAPPTDPMLEIMEDDQMDSPFVEFAQYELSMAGLFDPDSDYGGMIGDAVLELARVFSRQGHSGFSAGMVASIFHELTKYKPLTPLTSNPHEWNHITDQPIPLYQSSRSPSSFSNDGGSTYYDNDDPTIRFTLPYKVSDNEST